MVAAQPQTTPREHRGIGIELIEGVATVDGDARDADRPKPPWRARGWALSILAALVLGLTVRWCGYESFRVPTESMTPALLAGDRVFVNKAAYGIRWPFNGFRIPFSKTDLWYAQARLTHGAALQRWDVIAFKAVAPASDKHILVKRVVGLPGEHIVIVDGQVWIDGKQLPPPEGLDLAYSMPAAAKFARQQTGEIPSGHYFVLGDNSSHSRDSRHFGFLPERNVLGRVAGIWWPPARMGPMR